MLDMKENFIFALDCEGKDGGTTSMGPNFLESNWLPNAFPVLHTSINPKTSMIVLSGYFNNYVSQNSVCTTFKIKSICLKLFFAWASNWIVCWYNLRMLKKISNRSYIIPNKSRQHVKFSMNGERILSAYQLITLG